MEVKMNCETMKRMLSALALSSLLLMPVSSWARDDSGRWRDLSPKDRENILRNYQRWQNLPPQDKEHLREEWDRFKSLPQDRRDNLRRRYNDLRRDNR
jgi:Protein of unknown function (DUF3106)